MHARDLIRNAVKERLANIPGLSDHVVVDDELIVLAEHDAPWVFVWLDAETVVPRTLERKKERTAELNIDLIVRDRFNAIQQAEELAAQIEDLIDGDYTLAGLVRSVDLNGLILNRNEDSNVARLRAVFTVTYSTAAGNAAVTV